MTSRYIWSHPDWPSFRYDETRCQSSIYRYGVEAGRLLGGLGQLEREASLEATIDLMVSEAIHTSLIEGEKINRSEVRSSIKNFIEVGGKQTAVSDPRAEGIAALMVEVQKTFTQPLTPERLFQWHGMVLPSAAFAMSKRAPLVGRWRDSQEPMQIVSGRVGREKVHYEAPPAHRVEQDMAAFLAWYNTTNPLVSAGLQVPGPIGAAIAHLWFESIHPFDDGNGRIGRAIAEHALAQDLRHPPLISLSTTIEARRKDYYQELHQASGPSMDVTPWVMWFCETVLQAQLDAAAQVVFVLHKAKFWQQHNEGALHARQVKAINKIFAAGSKGFELGVSPKKYMAMTRCSKATATRDLAALVAAGIVRPLAAGRSTRYLLNLEELDSTP